MQYYYFLKKERRNDAAALFYLEKAANNGNCKAQLKYGKNLIDNCQKEIGMAANIYIKAKILKKN